MSSFIIHNVVQGTDEWLKLREGKFTASKGQAVAANGAGLKTLVMEKILESLGVAEEGYSNELMDRGNRLEPAARTAYEFETGRRITEVGFVTNPMIPGGGGSPDGLHYIGDEIERGIEIKARNSRIHFELLSTGKIDTKTVWQMQYNMLLLDAKRWDFVSYNPAFRQSLFIKTIEASDKHFESLKLGLEAGRKLLATAKMSAAYKKELALKERFMK